VDTTTLIQLLISAFILVVAIVYSSSGNAGASGYLAVLGLFDVSPIGTRPTILILNIIVAFVSTIRFYRAGVFFWRTFWPFAAGSIPTSIVAGTSTLPGSSFHKLLVSLIVFYSATQLFFAPRITVCKKLTLVVRLRRAR